MQGRKQAVSTSLASIYGLLHMSCWSEAGLRPRLVMATNFEMLQDQRLFAVMMPRHTPMRHRCLLDELSTYLDQRSFFATESGSRAERHPAYMIHIKDDKTMARILQ